MNLIKRWGFKREHQGKKLKQQQPKLNLSFISCYEKHTLGEKCPYLALFWFAFSHIWTEYGEIRSISPYSVQMRENTDQKHSDYGHFSRSDNHDQALKFQPFLQNVPILNPLKTPGILCNIWNPFNILRIKIKSIFRHFKRAYMSQKSTQTHEWAF